MSLLHCIASQEILDNIFNTMYLKAKQFYAGVSDLTFETFQREDDGGGNEENDTTHLRFILISYGRLHRSSSV